MTTTATSRGLTAIVAAPVVAVSIAASALGLSAVANAASVVPGVNTHYSGMTLSKEYIMQQKEEKGANVKPIDLEVQQEQAEPLSPAKQEANELKGDIKAEEVKEVALKTVESLANVQTPEPKSHPYRLKNPIHKHMGMMKAGWSQTAR